MNPLMAPEAMSSFERTALSVNLNKVALLRNTRALTIPSVTRAATIALEAGASGITVHPRPDARHIRAGDVHDLASLLKDWPQAEYNIEGNPFHNLMDFVRTVRPRQCTFVPDDVAQATSDHGWDLTIDGARLKPLIDEAHDLGVRVSLFMDPIPSQMPLLAQIGAERVELYTERYASAWGGADQAEVLASFVAGAEAAIALGIGINAGHDLNRDNLTDFLVAVPRVMEVSIGHALIADALEFGLEATVKAYLACIDRARMPLPSSLRVAR
jgi:pyridoxine 5-phosphate synthase